MNDEEMKLWQSEINQASKVKPWLVVFDRVDSPSTIKITEKQKQLLDSAVDEAKKRGSMQHVELKDGTKFTTNFRVVIRNPEWKDPEEMVKKIIFYKYQRDFSERRARGESITWEDYASTKKEEAQQISKQLKEAIDND